VPGERFFPSDAKRYLERCALWKATTPFLTPGDWGTNPVVERDKLGALPDEGAVFLGKGLPSGPFDFLETSARAEPASRVPVKARVASTTHSLQEGALGSDRLLRFPSPLSAA
jgi:hypothetical protein